MATKKRGNGKVVDVTVEILRDIRDHIKRMDERLERLEKLQMATVAGLNDLRSRFDHFLDLAGDKYRDHEERIRALEQRVLRDQ